MRICDWCEKQVKSGEGFYLTHATDKTVEVVVHNECWDDFMSWLIGAAEQRLTHGDTECQS